MANRRTKSKARGRPAGTGVKGHVQMIIQVTRDQRQALMALAEKRRGPEQARLPVSEVVRELLDEALRKRSK